MGVIGTVAGLITIIVVGGAIIQQSETGGIDMDLAKDIGNKILDTLRVWTN